jgi:hypothetical protein
MIDVFRHGDGCISVAVVAISVTEIVAASNAELVKHALSDCTLQGLNAAESVRNLNRRCIQNGLLGSDREWFATVFFAVIEPNLRTMQYVSAGLEAAYIVVVDEARPLRATGPIIGLIDDDSAFEHRVVSLSPDDILVVITDGFSEEQNIAREFRKPEALVAMIDWFRRQNVEEAQAVIMHAYTYAPAVLHDDATGSCHEILGNLATFGRPLLTKTHGATAWRDFVGYEVANPLDGWQGISITTMHVRTVARAPAQSRYAGREAIFISSEVSSP